MIVYTKKHPADVLCSDSSKALRTSNPTAYTKMVLTQSPTTQASVSMHFPVLGYFQESHTANRQRPRQHREKPFDGRKGVGRAWVWGDLLAEITRRRFVGHIR